ncbi:hypothetical protein T484DRAFT_1757716, partial [Baffinella frigidus]
MEYLNQDNIAVQVMHAAPAYIDTKTMSPLGNDPQNVTYRTYFLHPVSMQLRETHMWHPDSAVAQLSSGGSSLCPEMRMMPQFGSMVGEMTAAVILSTRMMVTFLVSAPTVLQQGMLSRLTECPLVHRGHSMLLNCGRNFLSLDASFAAMRVAHSHFWNSFAKLGHLLKDAPGGGNVQTFLQGSATYHVQIRTPLLRRNVKPQKMDYQYNDVKDFATKTYQSLLNRASGLPKISVDMIKQTGRQTMLFAQKLVSDSKNFQAGAQGYKMGGQFITATPGNFIRRLPGASIGVAAFGGSIIDSTQFAWVFVTRLVTKLLAVDGGLSMAPALWQATSDSINDYNTYLVKPAFRACSGIGIMLGYSNPWARLFRESCSAAVASHATAVSTALILFVDIPALACMCRSAGGRKFEDYARDACWNPAPLSIKPLLAHFISDSRSGTSQIKICNTLGEMTEDKMRAILDPVMQHGYAATQAVASSLDYLTTMFDPNAGSCIDLITSPYTMALVPEPVDYFRGCAKTQSCRARCITLFKEFENLKTRLLEQGGTFDFKSNVDKKFFSNDDVLAGRAAVPFEVLAMLEVPAMDLSTVTGMPCCGGGDARNRCIATTGITDTTELQVIEYCIPHRLDIGTHEHSRWTVTGSKTWVSGMHSVRFATRDLLIVALGGTVVMYRADGSSVVLMQPLAAGESPGYGLPRMHRVAWIFVAPANYAIVYGFVNSAENTMSTEVSACVHLDEQQKWPSYRVVRCTHNLNDKLSDHVVTCLGAACTDLLMVPTTSVGVMTHCTPDTASDVKPGTDMQFSCVDSLPRPGLSMSLGFSSEASATLVVTNSFVGVRRTPALCANTLFPGNASQATIEPVTIFSANPTTTSATWLQEISLAWDLQSSEIMYAGKSVTQKVGVSLTIDQRCDVDECSGCRVPSVQRACFAAQQCAVAKCIGTVVNLERPLCSVGRLLQAGLDVDLVKLHGVWTVLTDLVSFVLRSATGMKQSGVQIEFIDEVFFSLICEAKNGIIASMSILTSLINGLINSKDRELRQTNRVAQDQEAANAEAVRTMTSAATTNFLAQITLGVLYPPIIFKKTIMCHTDAFLSVFDVSGFELRLSSEKYASSVNSLVGMCLSEYNRESMQEPSSAQSQGNLGAMLQNAAVNAGTAIGQIPFERLLHMADGMFAYMIGIVSGLQDVIATSDQKHCNLPDTEADEISTCACGDHPVMIPDHRAKEGIEDGAFWCT